MDKILKKTPFLVFFIAAVSGLSSCKIYKQSILFSTDKEHNTEQIQQEVTAAKRNYTIKPHDYFSYKVYTNSGERLIDPDFELIKPGTANLQNRVTDTQYLVRPDGTADLPMIGNIKLEGLTLNQLDSVLQTNYNVFYKDTYVQSRIENKRVIMLGASGGKVIPFQNENMNLIEALALSEQTGRFKAQNIRLIRGDLQNPQVYIIDLSTIEGMKQSQLQLQPDDIIYVEPVVRIINETIRDATPIISLLTSTLSIFLFIQSIQNNNN